MTNIQKMPTLLAVPLKKAILLGLHGHNRLQYNIIRKVLCGPLLQQANTRVLVWDRSMLCYKNAWPSVYYGTLRTQQSSVTSQTVTGRAFMTCQKWCGLLLSVLQPLVLLVSTSTQLTYNKIKREIDDSFSIYSILLRGKAVAASHVPPCQHMIVKSYNETLGLPTSLLPHEKSPYSHA